MDYAQVLARMEAQLAEEREREEAERAREQAEFDAEMFRMQFEMQENSRRMYHGMLYAIFNPTFDEGTLAVILGGQP